MPLFVVYSIVYALGLTVDTVSYPVQRLLKVPHDPVTLSGYLIRTRMKGLIRMIQSIISMKKYQRKRKSILAKLAKRAGHHGGLMSGETYMLPLVHMQLRRVASFTDAFDKLKVRLAQHCELSIDPGLSRAILRALK
jgi:hypothetical protein